jgi:hypothetical protein
MKTLREFVRVVFFGFLILSPFSGSSVVPDPMPCARDLETNFFQYSLVLKAFALYQIPQGLWDPIAQSLVRKSQQIPDRMINVTANMVPNPIEYPMNKPATAKILKTVLFQVFLETLREYQVNERPSADYMFDYIFTQQLPRFVSCFGEEVRKLASDPD